MLRNKKNVPKNESKKEVFQNEVFINPKLVKVSKEKEVVDEGCLSVRYLYGKVKRSKKATIEAYGLDSKKFTMGGSGIIAQIFQHEMDHLRGVLFIDMATDLEELPPEHLKETKVKAKKR
jgi:peptide deformylase